MDWFKAIMIFMIISFCGVLVYICVTLEDLITEYGNLKAQIETLKNGHAEDTNIIAITELVDNDFKRTLRIYDSMNNVMHELTLRMEHLEKRLNVIEDAMEDRAKESSEVFEAVRNDINEIREDMTVLKANFGELLAGTDESPEFDRSLKCICDTSEHSRCEVEEENLNNLEAEKADQK